MGFNSGFKGLTYLLQQTDHTAFCHDMFLT